MPQYRNVKEFTDRIREAYSKYRAEYINISNAINNDKKVWSEELRRGWATPQEKQEATLIHDTKVKELRKAFESIEDRAKAEFDEIRAECVKVFEPYNRATASMVDMPTLELLKSGILKDNELIDLADAFSENITMLRLIGKYADERATAGGKIDSEMKSFAKKCKEAEYPYIVPVDSLANWSLKAIRGDKDSINKDSAMSQSNGIARVYDETADQITAEAGTFSIKVSE